ncbi:MAG TPA: O-antigen ligase family protein, partial [Candidatus Angelobacter sp.]|nr:O-antigen ligase family protein [Candidatus Angelobacter sp.]
LPYFFLRLLIRDWERFRWAFKALLWIGAAVCMYASVALYSHLLFGTSFGIDLEQYGDMPATYGLQFEPNILGAYSAALAIMMLVMYLHQRERKYLIGYAGFGLVTLGVSLSRAALGAAAVGIGVIAIVALRRRLINRQIILRVVAATLGAFLLVAPVFLPYYTQRFATIDISDPTTDPNTVTRAVQVLSALDEVEKHPIFGGGVSSFQLAFDWQTLGTEWEDQGWIGNTELRVLHDTGIVGLLVFLAFLFSLARQSLKQLKREFSPELLALLCSGVVYSITFQATEGTLLAFPWVQLGLIGCAVSVMRQEGQHELLAEPVSA